MVAVAEVARPHGVVGELRLKLYNEGSDLLTRRPRIRLLHADGVERDAALTGVREANKALLVRLAGVDDRNAAEALRGARILVARADFPPLDEGEFYACDIEGARAVLRSGEEVGRVAGIASYPTCEALVVDLGGGKRIEVPLVEAYVGAVDAARGVVELVTIEGLD
jgi:16S rRNA processing protein RimM